VSCHAAPAFPFVAYASTGSPVPVRSPRFNVQPTTSETWDTNSRSMSGWCSSEGGPFTDLSLRLTEAVPTTRENQMNTTISESLKIDADGITGQTVRRSLHFFWLVDVSLSMKEQRIQAVNYAIKNVLPEIRQVEDGERVNILMRAITFGEKANWCVGPAPKPVRDFQWSDLVATGSSTSTAQAIELLCEELALEKIGRRNVPPVAILLSDGYCTDPESRYDNAIAALDKLPWGTKAVRISIGVGPDRDYNKAQLDRFISPYLRQEAGLETLPAPDVGRLVQHIRVVSTLAAFASAASKSDLNDPRAMPVQIDVDALKVPEPGAGPLGGLDPNEVF